MFIITYNKNKLQFLDKMGSGTMILRLLFETHIVHNWSVGVGVNLENYKICFRSTRRIDSGAAICERIVHFGLKTPNFTQ